MSRRPTLEAIVLGILLWGSPAFAQDSVTFLFNPVELYDWRPAAEGFSTEGGVFKLHEVWQGPDAYESYDDADRPVLDSLKSSLEAGEGIGFFNVDLNESGNGMLWGQTLETPVSVDSVIAPPGWTGEINGNFVSWEASDPSLLLRPDTAAYDDGTSFGFSFTTDQDILGTEQTIWFGGFNFDGFIPAITFDDFPGGFPSNDMGSPGTGFEGTLRLTAVPEPATVILLGLALVTLCVRAGLGRHRGPHA